MSSERERAMRRRLCVFAWWLRMSLVVAQVNMDCARHKQICMTGTPNLAHQSLHN